MSDFFDGAVMAYRDGEEIIKDMGKRLPQELQFLKPQFDELSEMFGRKANNVIYQKQIIKGRVN